MNITSAEFKFSSGKISQIPDHGKLEFAFIGRSNVGKSSLVNMLTGRNLAKVSSTPGKTQHINHFLVNDSWWLVDLPGYGYARTSRNARESFAKIITDYVTAAPAMHYLFVLIDSRHAPQKIDLEFIEWLGENGVPFAIIFTKADKLTRSKLAENVAAYKKRLLEDWEELPPVFITSSETALGRDEVLQYIDEVNKTL